MHVLSQLDLSERHGCQHCKCPDQDHGHNGERSGSVSVQRSGWHCRCRPVPIRFNSCLLAQASREWKAAYPWSFRALLHDCRSGYRMLVVQLAFVNPYVDTYANGNAAGHDQSVIRQHHADGYDQSKRSVKFDLVMAKRPPLKQSGLFLYFKVLRCEGSLSCRSEYSFGLALAFEVE